MSSSDSMKKAIPVLSKNLGLTPTESKVLLPILLAGNMTVGAIELVTGLSKTKVKNALDSLISKELVILVEGVVPIYRALPPGLAMTDVMAGIADEMIGFGTSAYDSIEKGISQTDEVVGSVSKARKARMKKLRQELDAHEAKTLEIVKSQIDAMIKSSSQVLSDFFETAESVLKELETHLDTNLERVVSELKTDLESTNKILADELAKIDSEFQDALARDVSSSKEMMTVFEDRAKGFISSTQNIVTDVISSMEKRIEQTILSISTDFKTRAIDATDPAIEILNSASEEVGQSLEHLNSSLSHIYKQARESITGLHDRMSKLTDEYADFVKTRTLQALEVTKVMQSDIDAWKREAATLVDSATQTVTNHLKQISAVDASYIDGMENTLTQYLETTSSLLSDEYGQVRGLIASVRKDFDGLVTSSRSSIVELLQKQVDADQEHLTTVREKLINALDTGVKTTESKIKQHIDQAVEELTTVLGTEVNELSDLVTNLDSRLRSAFGSIITSTHTRNTSVISGAQKFIEEFESSFINDLNEILTRFSNQISTQAESTKAIYETISARLDERLADGVSTIKSHVERVDEEIEAAMTDQIGRLDRHAEGIRQEFHVQMDEITQQFISLVQGLEVAFNGFLSNQTIEARDLIKSTHSAFKAAIDQEMATLRDDSLKLQQEYASEIGMKIEEVAQSAATARKALEDLTATHGQQITDGLHQTLTKVQSVLEGIETSLREIESGTVRQVGESLVQMTREFETSITGVRDNVAERLATVHESVISTLKRGVTSARNATETFLNEELDRKQRFVADASKKLDALSAKIGKSASSKFEVYTSAMAERETALAQSRNQLKDETLSKIRQRRAEVVESLDAAAVWIDSTMANIGSSIMTLGDKLGNEVIVVQQGLSKASSEVAKAIVDKGVEHGQKVEAVANDLLKELESLVAEQTSELVENVSVQIERAQDGVNSVRRNVEDVSLAIAEQTSISLDEVLVETDSQLEAKVTELNSSLDAAVSGLEVSAERIRSLLLDKRDELFEATKEALSGVNKRTLNRFESVGLSLKTHLSSDIYNLTETVRNQISAHNEHLSDTRAVVTTDLSEEASRMKSVRDEMLHLFEGEFDKSMKTWSSSVRKNLEDLKVTLDGIINRLTKAAKSSITTISAVREACDILTGSEFTNTWYLRGTKELCAHMLDMAVRAKDSIVISVSDIDCLDLKKLAKVDGPIRRILVIPVLEEHSTLEAPAGWRVIEMREPPTVAVRDNEEIVIGGIDGDGLPFAVVSTDPTYLKLYHDIVGPQIIRKHKR